MKNRRDTSNDLRLPVDNLDPNGTTPDCPAECPRYVYNLGNLGTPWLCEHRAAELRPHARQVRTAACVC